MIIRITPVRGWKQDRRFFTDAEIHLGTVEGHPLDHSRSARFPPSSAIPAMPGPSALSWVGVQEQGLADIPRSTPAMKRHSSAPVFEVKTSMRATAKKGQLSRVADPWGLCAEGRHAAAVT